MARLSPVQKIHQRLSADLPINSQVSIAIVADPYSDIGEQIQVLRSIRNDPLAGLKSRGFIEEHEYQAGRRWQVYYEASQIGGVRAIDPTKQAVDGGRTPDPISDGQIKAIRALGVADKELGQEGSILVRDVLAHSLTVKEAAARRGLSTKREELYIGARFRECLDTLAEHWGLATSQYPQLIRLGNR